MPRDRLREASRDLARAQELEWRILSEGERAQAARQERFVNGLEIIYTLCNGRRDRPELDWDLGVQDDDLRAILPESVDFEVTRQVVPCEVGKAFGQVGDYSFLWNQSGKFDALTAAEDLSLRLGPGAAVVHYVMHVPPSLPRGESVAEIDEDEGSAPPATKFMDVAGFGGVCAPSRVVLGEGGLVDSGECGSLFMRHLRGAQYGAREVGAPAWLLRKDFDYLQRLVLLRGIADHLGGLDEYLGGHFFAPVSPRVLYLVERSLDARALVRGPVEEARRAHFETRRALGHPSLVGMGTIPDLHRLLLMCPYFLPVISIVLRALLSAV